MGGGLGVYSCKKLFISSPSGTKNIYFFHIFCNGIYTWSLGANIFFAVFEEELISKFFLAPPPTPAYLMVDQGRKKENWRDDDLWGGQKQTPTLPQKYCTTCPSPRRLNQGQITIYMPTPRPVATFSIIFFKNFLREHAPQPGLTAQKSSLSPKTAQKSSLSPKKHA